MVKTASMKQLLENITEMSNIKCEEYNFQNEIYPCFPTFSPKSQAYEV